MKYYYKDALAAAYMCREFGVKLSMDAPNCIIQKVSLDDILSLVDYDCKLEVNANSLHILEPQVGDLVRVIAKNGTHSDSDQNPPDVIYHLTETHFWRVGKETSLECGGIGKLRKNFKFCKILQRNGLQFFIPEVENE